MAHRLRQSQARQKALTALGLFRVNLRFIADLRNWVLVTARTFILLSSCLLASLLPHFRSPVPPACLPDLSLASLPASMSVHHHHNHHHHHGHGHGRQCILVYFLHRLMRNSGMLNSWVGGLCVATLLTFLRYPQYYFWLFSHDWADELDRL